MQEIWDKLDLTKNDVKLYSAVLESPNLTIAEIARKIKMDKSSAYMASNHLVEKNLIIPTFNERNTTYKAVSPVNLKSIYRLKLEEYKAEENLLDEFIKKLSQSSNAHNSYISITSGLEAYKLMMEESLSSKEKLIREKVVNFHRYVDKKYVDYVKEEYVPQRVKKKIFMRQVEYKIAQKDDPLFEIMTNQKAFLKQIKYTNDEIAWEYSLRIWDNTVNLFKAEQEGLTIITIKDPAVAALMKAMYDFIWKRI